MIYYILQMSFGEELLQIFRQLKPENQSLLLAAAQTACVAEDAEKKDAGEQMGRDEGRATSFLVGSLPERGYEFLPNM
jgi:hypothetical protein